MAVTDCLGSIIIRVIQHRAQRYDTLGDWQIDPGYTDEGGRLWGTIHKINVSQLGHANFEFLCALHELVEMWWCQTHGITTEAVDAWDLGYPMLRERDPTVPDEPGEHPGCPYYLGHLLASQVEEQVARECGIDWDAYTRACEEVTHGQEKEEEDHQGQGASDAP